MDDNKTPRERRLAEALRANLQRRKQARQRSPGETDEACGPDGAGGDDADDDRSGDDRSGGDRSGDGT